MNLKRPLALSVLVLPAILPAARAYAVEQLIPAGSVIQCTVSEPKINSKVDKIGDAVLCQVSHFEVYGRAVFPYGSYLEGRFEDYKDPGHFVGKGWMELKFDRLIVGNDTVVPISARVVATPKNPVDSDGHILGTGHATRDIVEWSIPLLWPIDLINLPRRGPRPTLKAETRLTIKVLDDVGIPSQDEVVASQPALASRHQIAPAPIEQAYAPQQNYAPPQQQYAPQQYAPQQPPQTVIYNYAPAAPQQPQQPIVQYVQSPPVVQYVQAPPPPPVYVYPRPYAYPYGYRGYYPY